MRDEFTNQQAADLARYFLGPGWIADSDAERGVYWIIRNAGIIRACHSGQSWREVFRKAGVRLPLRRRFTAIGSSVMNGDESVAAARSKSMAERIAAALNVYEPDRRGS